MIPESQPRIPAKFFGGAAPDVGIDCSIAFIGEMLQVYGSHPHTVAAEHLLVHIGGADDDALLLHWSAAEVAYSVVVENRAAQRTLLAGAPSALASQLQRWRGKAGLQRFKWNAVLTGLALFAMLVALVIWQNDRVEGWLAARVPQKTEERLGEASFRQLSVEGRLTQEGKAATAVRRIGDLLTKGSRYQYRWYVKDDDTLNAFALPGGIVIVHSGLIERTTSAEELAGVLAHEVQHLEQRHGLRQMIHSAGWATLLAVTLGDVSAITAVLIHQAGNLSNSRELELQADLGGVRALEKAGISPHGMANFFKRMADDAGPEIPFLSTHPAPADRLVQIEATIRQHPCTHCTALPYDWQDVRASLKDMFAGHNPRAN